MDEIRKDLIKISDMFGKINNKIKDILLTPEESITKSQEKQLLKLKQERLKIKIKYFKKLLELPNTEEEKFRFKCIIRESKDKECRLFYLAQSKH